MSRTGAIRRFILRTASAAVVVSSLALGTQAGAWRNGCEHGVDYTIDSIAVYGVNFPVLVPHAWAHCS